MEATRRVSGSQLTVMVVAICAAVVLAPVGVYAAAHSSTSIVDAKHPTRGATVSSKGALSVAGTVKVSGTSVVAALPTLRGTPYAKTLSSSTETISIPKGKTLVITTVSGLMDVAPGAKPYVSLSATGGPFSDNQLPITMTFAEPDGTYDVWTTTSDVEIPVPGPGTVSMSTQTSSGAVDAPYITVVGYLV